MRVSFPIACGCGFLLACGGQVASDVSGASSDVHSGDPGGTGFYTLSIESLSDSCQPARIAGDRGEELVSVADSGIHASFWFSTTDGSVGNDVSFTTTTEFDLGPNGCPNGVLHASLGPAARMAAGGLDVPVTELWEGVASCPSPPPDAGAPSTYFFPIPAADCESHRVYHYKWSRPCPALDAGGIGIHCG
jgi:hypothetical protein